MAIPDLLAELLDRDHRSSAARQLAQHLGAQDLIPFVRDAEIGVLLPAAGFAQTLPEGRRTRALVAEALVSGLARGEIRHPETGQSVAALACSAPDGSVLMVIGGDPVIAAVQETTRYLPLVSQALRLEREAMKARVVTREAQHSATQARALATSLDETRRELQRAYYDAESARRRSAFLAQAATVLGSSLDYETTLEEVARLAVPFLADVCVIDLLERGQTLMRLAATCSTTDPSGTPTAPPRRLRGHLDGVPPGLAAVLRSGAPELVNDAPTPLLLSVLGQRGLFDDVDDGRSRSYVCVPLLARGRSIGTLLFLSAPGGRRFVASDLELATAIAVRAALAVDNARLYRDAQEAIRARNDFLSMAAHELRTPITPVQLLLHSLERMVAKEPIDRVALERIRSKITSAVRQADRLGGLVNNLLDLSRLTAGRLDLNIEQVDLSAVIDEVSARFSDELTRAGCALSVKHPGPVLGQWDKFRLEQVITNHLTNAMKYGQGKPIDIEVTATEAEAVLQVRDRGIGISTEDQTRLFRQFERAAPARSYGGVGLGLWIVRQIVAALDGQVSVTSELGVGSTFTVRLPRAGTAHQTNQVPNEVPAASFPS